VTVISHFTRKFAKPLGRQSVSPAKRESALNIYPINKAYFAGCPPPLFFFTPATFVLLQLPATEDFDMTGSIFCPSLLIFFALYYLQSEVFRWLLVYFIFFLFGTHFFFSHF